MSKLIFVTGASGFLASQIIYQLIQEGYRVRGTVRPKKAEALKALYKSTSSVEIVEVSDIADDQFSEALKGVDAVIHTASPLPGRTTIDIQLKSAIEGSLNVLRQAEKAGITKFVVTSSTAAVVGDPSVTDGVYTVNHWNPLTKEDATNPMNAYEISKKYAELAIWEWAEANPHIDITTINPPFIYGPFCPLSLPVSPGDFFGLSSNILAYNFLAPNGSYPPNPGCVDIRDVARGHVAALRTPPRDVVKGRKRVIFPSPHGFVYKEVADLIRRERPEIAERVIQRTPPELSYTKYTVDFDRVEEVTGFKKEDFYPLEQTMLDAVDSLLRLEKSWKEQGYTGTFPDIPPA